MPKAAAKVTATAPVPPTTGAAAARRINRIHLLLAVQSVILVLASINRLSSATESYVAGNEFLRWVDLLNLLAVPVASLGAFYLLKRALEYDNPARNGRLHIVLSLVFVLGVYLTGASYGVHEVTNYLNGRFCEDGDTSAICRIIVYNDDGFSHYVFFTGFLLVNASMLLIETLFPHTREKTVGGDSLMARMGAGSLTARDTAITFVNALFVGAAIFANLAFEPTGFDLAVVAALTLLSVGLVWRRGLQPLSMYYSVGYAAGLVATLVKTAVD